MGTNLYHCFLPKRQKVTTAITYLLFNNETDFCLTQVSDWCFGQQHTHILTDEGKRV
jgi:hypothetical protein